MERREIPSILLEQYVLNELGDESRNRLESEFGTEYLEQKKQEFAEQNRMFLHAYPAPEMKAAVLKRMDSAEQVNEKTHERKFRRSRILTPLLSAAALVIVLAGVLPIFLARGNNIPETRIKGAGTHLLIYKADQENRGTPELLREGALVAENDIIQIKYVPAGKKYGIVFSIDGRGNVTRMYPETGLEAAPLEPERTGTIGYGYQLDDAPDFERFFFITADKAFGVEKILGAAESLSEQAAEAASADLRLPRGIDQTSFLLIKGEYNE
jgi:hypothetical protein